MLLRIYLFFIPAHLLALSLFILMLLAVASGFKLSKRIHQGKAEQNSTTSGFLAALYALGAFILGFTFSMSATRFELRRNLIVNEANVIGTAVLRANLYPDSIKSNMNALFKNYVDARIRYNNITADDTTGLSALMIETERISKNLFLIAADFSKQPGALVPSNQMIPALNEMIDIATSRHMGYLAIVPETIIFMLFLLTICSAFLAGYANKGDGIDWMVTTGFCILTTLVIYITLDLDRPRRGLIKLEHEENLMTSIRASLD